MKKSSINPFSVRRIKQIQDETPARIALCKRAGGTPVTSESSIQRKGVKYPYTKVVCDGGICECGLADCPRYPAYGEHLEPHEYRTLRSHGGIVSLDNSIMVLRRCHRILQNNEPKWSKL